MRTAFASAVPACALILANACAGETTDDELSASGDAKADHIFLADVTAHFNCDRGPDCAYLIPDYGDDASDGESDADPDSDTDADAGEAGG